MLAIIKKEFKSYFCTPVGYVCIGIYLLAYSLSFYITSYSSGSVNFAGIFYTFPIIIAMILIISLLTMRSFSEERKSGTEQLLLTSPLSITSIVLGKFFAVVFVAEIFTFMYYAILCYFGKPDLATSLVAMLGFLLLNMAYISFGILASSITENQIIAGIITIGFFILNWILPSVNNIFENYTFIDLLNKFIYGQIDIADTVTYVSFTGICILLTITLLQRRKSVK